MVSECLGLGLFIIQTRKFGEGRIAQRLHAPQNVPCPCCCANLCKRVGRGESWVVVLAGRKARGKTQRTNKGT